MKGSEDIIEMLCARQPSSNSKDSSQVIGLMFGTPEILLERINEMKTKDKAASESEIDLELVRKLYNNLSHYEKDLQIGICINQGFQKLEQEGQLKKFLKSSQEMKYFFILLFWEKMFTFPEHRATLFRYFKLLSQACYYNRVFIEWLRDISANQLTSLITRIHEKMGSQFQDLSNENLTKQGSDQIQSNLRGMCNFMGLLYESNKQKPRVAPQAFVNKAINEYFDPVEQFQHYRSKSNVFNFINYPCLLSFEFKHRLVQIESIYEQNLSIKKAMRQGISHLISNFSGNNSIDGLIYLYFAVNRDNILDDSMEKLGRIKENLKSPLKIEFINEPGTDEGGVKNQYFQLIVKSIFNPYLDMFVPKNNGRYQWFNGNSYEMPLRFEFVGMILALSIFNSVHLDIHFPDVIYKKLLHEDECGIELLEDLKEIEPQICKGLKKIMEMQEPIEDLELYFSIEIESFGIKNTYELVEDGSQIQVTQDNKEYYCISYADYLLNKHIEKKFIPFKKGFHRVVSHGILEIFQPYQLRTLICGIEEINMEELQASTSYEGGYTPESPVIKHLWSILKGLSQQNKKSFMFFVTGTDRVPIDGLKSLNFLIQRHSNTTNLPTAHTCFNVFLLPEYESRDILEKNIHLILQNNQGFGLI